MPKLITSISAMTKSCIIKYQNYQQDTDDLGCLDYVETNKLCARTLYIAFFKLK